MTSNKRDLDLSNEDKMWYGRNKPQHGHEFFLGISGYDVMSISIPKKDRKKAARFFEAFAKRLREAK